MELNKLIKMSDEDLQLPLTLNEVDGSFINESFKTTLKSIENSIDINLFDEITRSMSIDQSFQLLQTYFFIGLNQKEISVNSAEYDYLLRWIEDLFDEIKQ
ncbi:hypothetical protein IJD44_01990 [bacterium]|nr:hypothetical protein [bacterium]